MADLGRARYSMVQPGTVLNSTCAIFSKSRRFEDIKYDTVTGCCWDVVGGVTGGVAGILQKTLIGTT